MNQKSGGKDMIVVKFLQRQAPYNVGEIAGFKKSIANILIEKGIAEAVEEVKERTSDTEEDKAIQPRRTSKKEYVTK